MTGCLRVRRLVAAAVLAAGLGAALAGCSTDRLGSAAVVGGEPVSTEEVQRLARDYLEVVPGGDPRQVQLAVLQQTIVDRIFQEGSRDTGVRVRDGRVAARLGELIEQTGGRAELVQAISSQTQQVVAPGQLEQWMRNRLLFERLAVELGDRPSGPPTEQALNRANRTLTRYANRLDIEVSPRYGSWNPDSGITPLVSGGLSRSEEELAGGRS